MDVADFRDTLDKLCATNSRNEKKDIIREVGDSRAAISFLSGSQFDDAGLGKKTVLSCAQEVYPNVDGEPTVSQSLEAEDNKTGESRPLATLYTEMEILAEESGNNQKVRLEQMFETYDYPSVVAQACLDDQPTGVGDSRIANALDVKDSLPFYEGVHEIAGEDDPLTEPKVGLPFDPQLAVPESRSPDFVDE
jgi:hypothetical protein